ncbi:MAG: hypothetical protein DBX67_03915 [Desulfovibrionaceae bacterium]|nr:MAG: hypothetical protein DBX67_03915 [Desulfovibrionaceae bacterium]
MGLLLALSPGEGVCFFRLGHFAIEMLRGAEQGETSALLIRGALRADGRGRRAVLPLAPPHF